MIVNTAGITIIIFACAGSAPGDMGVIFQTLIAVVGLEGPQLVPWAALLLGLVCLACGLVTVLAAGLAPNVQGLVLNTNAFGPWAATLASDTVTVNNVAAPVYSVGNVNGSTSFYFYTDGSPQLMAYLACFGTLFLVLRWWRQADPLRGARLSLWWILVSSLVAGVVASAWHFPQ